MVADLSCADRLPCVAEVDVDAPFTARHGYHRKHAMQLVELKHLRSAVLAHRHGSFRKAANLVAVRHSAFSRSIAELERYIGMTLFVRSRTGVQATVAGNRFLDRASTMLGQIDALLGSANEAADRSADRLSLGLCTSSSARNLQPILADGRQTEISIVERPLQELYAGLRSRSVDIIIVPEMVQPPPGAEARALWRERILVALPSNHVLAKRQKVRWADLIDHAIILGRSEPANGLEALLRSELSSYHISPSIQRHDASQRLIYSLVAMGLGVSLISESDVGPADDDLACLELHNSEGPIQMFACARWLPENDSPAVARFLSLLAERYPSLPTDANEQDAVAL